MKLFYQPTLHLRWNYMNKKLNHYSQRPDVLAVILLVLGFILTVGGLPKIKPIRVEARQLIGSFTLEPGGLQATNELTNTVYLPVTMRSQPIIQGHGILFVSDRAGTGPYDVYNMNLDGSSLKRLTFTGGFEPKWSPDGTKILALLDWALYILQPDGTDLEPLVDDPMLRVVAANWSPDGKKIAYIVRQCLTPRPDCSSMTDSGSGLRVIDVQTRDVSVVINNLFLKSSAGVHWTPDSLSLLTVADNYYNTLRGILVSRLDDLTVTQILSSHNIADFAIAPNGQQVAFIPSHYFTLYTAAINGANVQLIHGSLPGELVSTVAWHPDSGQVAYRVLRNVGNEHTVFISSVIGGGAYELTPYDQTTRKRLLGWTPDGTQFLYMSDVNRDYQKFDIYVVNADGSNPVNLTADSPANDIATDYHP